MGSCAVTTPASNEKVTTVLIKAYAQYWNPDVVEWRTLDRGNGGKLLGKVKIKGRSHEINFWDAKGIYVLHEDFRTVYVGKAWGTSIGKRLRDHLTDRFAGRWDMFSWFSTSTLVATNKSVKKPGKRQLGPKLVIDTIEALGILITNAPLNRRHETIPDAIQAEQSKSPNPSTIRHYLETILKEVKCIQPKT
jgi:hypothetical protein